MATNTSQQPTTAGDTRDANIPFALQAPALVISAEPTYATPMPTIFVGIVDKTYPEGHWRDHCDRIKRLFQIADANLSMEIKVNNRGNQKIDAQQLTLDIVKAMTFINGQTCDRIRIVRFGVGSSIGLDRALESLIQGWNMPSIDKRVQLVALGESQDNQYWNFCKMLRLKELPGQFIWA